MNSVPGVIQLESKTAPDSCCDMFFGDFVHVLGTPKPTRTLLIELGTRCHSINGHVDTDFGFDNLRNDAIQVMHNSQHHVSFRKCIGNIHVIGMCASVNNAIHVEIEVIKFRQQGGIGHDLINLGIAFTDPSVKL